MKRAQSSLKLALGLTTALSLAFAANEASAKCRGIDVSNNNGSVTWSSVYDAGIRFAICKATEGNYFQDGYYHSNMQHAKNNNIIIGGYHFARPDRTDGNVEANYFYSFAASEWGTGGKTLQPVCDIEVWSGHVGATSYTDWANQFADTLTTKMNNAGMTHNTLVYTSSCNACNFNTNIKGHGWLANYNGQDPDTGGPWNVCGSCNVWGSGWQFWQYTASGSVGGVSGNCDRDVYNGNLTDLQGSIYIVNPH